MVERVARRIEPDEGEHAPVAKRDVEIGFDLGDRAARLDSEQGPKADGTLRCREQRRTGGKQRLERTPRNKAVVRALAQHCEKRILVQHERDSKQLQNRESPQCRSR